MKTIKVLGLAALVGMGLAGQAKAEDFMIRAMARQAVRERAEMKFKYNALLPAFRAVKWEQENIEGRIRAGVATAADHQELAEIEAFPKFYQAGDVVAYSETEAGRAFFTKWAARAETLKVELEEWKESL